jgi:hypothetical protein
LSIDETASREQEHCAQRKRREHVHAALVEQAIEQPLAGQIGIDQFSVFRRRDQRLALNPGFVFPNPVRDRAFRRVAPDANQAAAPAPAGRCLFFGSLNRGNEMLTVAVSLQSQRSAGCNLQR